MLIIFGSKQYGRVDEVRGLFHVTSAFVHVFYVPLIPFGSRLIHESQSGGYRHVPIRLRLKSVALGWLRSWLVLAGMVGGVVAFVQFLDHKTWWPYAGGAGAAFAIAAALTWLRPFRYAGYARAVELAERYGLSKEGRARLELAFGNLDAEEAEDIIKAAREADERRREAKRRKKAAASGTQPVKS
jgi:hypothetical protein